MLAMALGPATWSWARLVAVESAELGAVSSAEGGAAAPERSRVFTTWELLPETPASTESCSPPGAQTGSLTAVRLPRAPATFDWTSSACSWDAWPVAVATYAR